MVRRRKPIDEHHDNHERWLVSYADFITLLFAFFVVMYSLSTVNEGKYRVLSDSLITAFRSVTVNQPSEQVVVPPIVVPMRAQPPVSRSERSDEDPREAGERAAAVERMGQSIRRVLEPLTRTGQVNISEGAHGITVEINASVLFPAAGADLEASGRTPLIAVAEVFAAGNFPVTIEGHTDDIPIATARFPSNWELSSARASAVVRLFADAGVDPSRLSAIGYSDQRPIAENTTPEGRARNRRVMVRLDAMYNDPAPLAPGYIRPGDPMRMLLGGD